MAQKVAPTTWHPLHYGDVLEDSARGRLSSRIAGLRLLNNEVKRRLIQAAASTAPADTPLRVADLCCGRGGVVQKFVDASDGRGLRYVGMDVTAEQISIARDRFASRGEELTWIVGDCFAEPTARAVLEALGGKAHVVSCQFALHYAFKESRILMNFLNVVRDVCAPGGSFVFSTTDADMVIEYATQEQHDDSACSIALDAALPDGPFGAGLMFKLDDRVNDREYLVHKQTLHAELVRRGFVRKKLQNLQHFASANKCAAVVPKLTHEDWSLARLYVVGHYVLT